MNKKLASMTRAEKDVHPNDAVKGGPGLHGDTPPQKARLQTSLAETSGASAR